MPRICTRLMVPFAVYLLGCEAKAPASPPGPPSAPAAAAGAPGADARAATGGAGGGAGAGGGQLGGSGGGGGGAAGSGGTPSGGTGGTGGSAGAGGSSGSGGSDAAAAPDAGGADSAPLPRFSFFVTSIEAIRTLSNDNKGFGGDLRFGQADGLSGADEICRRTAEMGMPGAGRKTWRAFLSAVAGPDGRPVNAIDRVGEGPWYDRIGRLVAASKADLAQNRPRGASAAILNDLPNEHGIPNGHPNPGGPRVDNHHMLTGSKGDGTVYSMNKRDTCNDWTSKVGSDGRPRAGVSWPRAPGDHWISWGFEGGCAPGYNLVDGAGPTEGNSAVGSNGGYGGFYCLALQP